MGLNLTNIDRIEDRLLPILYGNVRTESEFEDKLGSDRFFMYVYGYYVLKQNWIKGIGYGTFREEVAKVYQKEVVQHNVFMRVFIGTGVVGFSVLIYILLYTIIKIIRLRKEKTNHKYNLLIRLLGVSITSQFFMGLANPIMLRPWIYFGLALFAATLSQYRNSNQSNISIPNMILSSNPHTCVMRETLTNPL